MIAPKFYSLWAINGALDQRRLRSQLDQLKAAAPVDLEFFLTK